MTGELDPTREDAPRRARPEDERLVEQTRARVTRRLGARDLQATFAIAALFVAAALALLIWAPAGNARGGLGVTGALVVCYAIAARIQFEVAFAFAVPTQLVFVPMLFLAPLRAVPLLVALGLVLSKLPEHVRGDWHPARAGIHLVSAWYAVGPVLVLLAFDEPNPTLDRLPILAAVLVAQFAFDFFISAARGWLALGLSPKPLVRAVVPAWFVDLALTPLGFLLAFASLEWHYAFLLGLPLLGLLAYFARERKARIDHALELSHAYRGTALLLGDMVEADDEYTGLHSQDVVELVVGVAERLQLDSRARMEAELTALLHDVGKVKVPKTIINKAGPLTEEERAVINLHTIEGEQMLKKVGGLLGEIGHLVRFCHERWDGAGYPDGIEGEAIPLVSRIVCACDAFSAMTSDRPYRKAMPYEAAIAELLRCAGTQFDPRVVEAIVDVTVSRAASALAA